MTTHLMTARAAARQGDVLLLPIDTVADDELGELIAEGMSLPLVRVINSTPEPDGTRNVYVLTAAREDCRTAHDAVASTFGLTAATYQPAVQT